MESRNQSLTVGEWLVEPKLNRISRADRHVSLRPQTMDLLVYLARGRGQVISADELIDDVWNGVIVGSGSVYNGINELRQAFGDDLHDPEYIETIPKRGYRLIAPVVFGDQGEAERPAGPGRSGAPVVGARAWLRAGRATQIMSGLLVLALVALIYQLARTPEPPAMPGPLIAARSIAVMPFKDLSPGDDQEYFTDGITEELLNTLAGVEGLKVAARISSFYFKNREPSVGEISKALGVAHILEGSVRRAGNRVRITAQLIDAGNGFHLWSQTYDRELADIFAIQDEISVAIVDALRDKLDLGRGDIGDPKAAKAVNPGAHTEYLLGRNRMNQRTVDAFKAAIQHFRKAIGLDESYAPAHANLAITYGLLANYEMSPRDQAYEMAKPFAERAMELDPDLAEAHAAMFFMQFLKDIHDPDLKYLNRAIALNPSYMDARMWKGGELSWRHRIEEGMSFQDSSLKIDPLSIIHNINLAANLLEVGRRDEAKVVAERMKSIDFGWGQSAIADIAYARGDLPGAVEAYLSGLKNTPKHGPLIFGLAAVFSELGLGTEAQGIGRHPLAAYFINKDRGNWSLVLKIAREGLEGAGETTFFIPALAEALYFNRDFEGAVTYYDRILPANSAPGYIPRFLQNEGYVFYAAALREVGNPPTAKVVFGEALKSVAGRQAAGHVNGLFYHLKGLTLLYQGRIDDALDALEQAFDAGNRNNWEFAAPLLDPVRDHPRFVALAAKYETARQQNRASAVALICGANLPDIDWSPLPQTCEGRMTDDR